MKELPMPGEREPWEELEYRELFERFPIGDRAPSGPEAKVLAHRLGRTVGAIQAQWEDGRSYCSGSSNSVASDQLKSWLDRNRMCP
jgi:hypothetical protein